jgi:enoyl-CoA hydratase
VTESDGQKVGFETRGHIAVITIARPDARNAVDADVAAGLEEAIDRLDGDVDLRVGVLAADGPAFCAGADLRLIADGRREEMYTERGGFAGFTSRLRVKPLIAAVDGPAVAGGMEIVLSCDLVVGSTRARFALPEVKRSLVAAGGGLFRAARVLPWPVALEMLLTGDALTAERAHELGWVAVLTEPGEALEAALALGQRIAVNAPLAVQRSLAEASAALIERDAELWRRSRAAMDDILQTDDAAEGPRAFLEHRDPVWSGR